MQILYMSTSRDRHFLVSYLGGLLLAAKRRGKAAELHAQREKLFVLSLKKNLAIAARVWQAG